MREVRMLYQAMARAASRSLKLLSRAEPVARGSIWTVSILVIAVYAVTFFSRPGPSEVAPEVHSFSFNSWPMGTEQTTTGESQIETWIVEKAAPPPGAIADPEAAGTTPSSRTQLEPSLNHTGTPSPVPPPPSPVPACAREGDLDCNCADFATQVKAQAFSEEFLPEDPHSLDVDKDGVVCEWMQ
jgi:hypothetical protein